MAPACTRYRDLIAIGASAGGAQTLTELVSGLPAELPAAVLVAQHTSPSAPPVLGEILSRAGKLPATPAVDGEPIERGRIYVARPDHHLLVGEEHLVVSRGPRENGHRPAVDPMFRSAARHYRQRVIAVVLSGTLDDGSAGLIAVKARGGVVIAQDPEDALHSAMPRNAIERDHPDYVVPVSGLADLLCTLVEERLHPAETNGQRAGDRREGEHTVPPSYELRAEGAVPVPITCPECSGPHFEGQGSVKTFHGLVGHRFSPASLDQEQAHRLEAMLWNAVRGLYERGELLRRLAGEAGSGKASQLYLDRGRAVEEQAEAIITAIQRLGTGTEQQAASESDQYMKAST
jgi:two-component system chemotaxis response regulator CheB